MHASKWVGSASEAWVKAQAGVQVSAWTGAQAGTRARSSKQAWRIRLLWARLHVGQSEGTKVETRVDRCAAVQGGCAVRRAGGCAGRLRPAHMRRREAARTAV